MSHEDFRYVSEAEIAKTAEPMSQRAKNEIAYRAAGAAYRIRNQERDPKKWGALLDQLPEEIRFCCREYLTQAYRSMQKAQRCKQTAVGDAELAKIGEIARRL